MTDLKPCPFCGSEDYPEIEFNGHWYQVACVGCDAAGASFIPERDAITFWNTRSEAGENRASNWIPVSERLPEPLQVVLAYSKAGEWYATSFNGYMEGMFTHWQPLPEPPKESER